MRPLLGAAFAVAFIACASSSPRMSATTPAPPEPRVALVSEYRLNAQIAPQRHAISATASIRLSESSGPISLFLNRTFEVQSVRVNGAPRTFRWGDEDNRLPYVDVARLLVVKYPKRIRSSSC